MSRSRRPGVLMSVFTTVCVYGIIFPQPNFDKIPLISEWAKRCAREAIELYNNKHDAEFQFTRVVKLNSMGCAGYNFYISFEAKAKDAAPMYFQALVYAGIPTRLPMRQRLNFAVPNLNFRLTTGTDVGGTCL